MWLQTPHHGAKRKADIVENLPRSSASAMHLEKLRYVLEQKSSPEATEKRPLRTLSEVIKDIEAMEQGSRRAMLHVEDRLSPRAHTSSSDTL